MNEKFLPLLVTAALSQTILLRVARAKDKGLIPQEKIWLGIYFDREIERAAPPPVVIRTVDEEVGLGVFLEKKIPRGAYIGEYTGVVMEKTAEEIKEKVYCVRYPVWDTPTSPFVIDGEERGNFTRFLNHSEGPNLSLQSVYWRGMPRMIFTALREIFPGEQLTFDYGAFFWQERNEPPKIL